MMVDYYRAGVPDTEAIGTPPSNDAVWRVEMLDTGAFVGVVAEPGKCLSRADAAQQAMEVYGLPVGSFRVRRIR